MFEQDPAIYWVDRTGTPHLLEDMSIQHVRNVIAYLERNASYFYCAMLRRTAVSILGEVLLGRIPTEMIACAAGATPLSELSSTEWLSGTPLMIRLQELDACGGSAT